MITNGQNFYEILEINEDATLQEIERAYMEAKETYSPTSAALYSMFSKEEANELHRLIEQAYTTLTNHDLRRDYDAKNLNSNKTTPENTNSPLFINQPEPPEQISVQNGLLIKSFDADSSMDEQIEKLTDPSGAFLQKVRKYKNISLDDVSKFSKVSKTNILAIEEEDFENLPARVFVRGFVVQICKLLGIDPINFSKEYLKSLDEFRK
ncbi:MAG: helix-turn-helix domain-containing protein [Bdellovibrionales bacterium]